MQTPETFMFWAQMIIGTVRAFLCGEPSCGKIDDPNKLSALRIDSLKETVQVLLKDALNPMFHAVVSAKSKASVVPPSGLSTLIGLR